jgi:hypothetical protein
MRDALTQGLRRHGVPQKRFHYELFEIRTGIGLATLARWLWQNRAKAAALPERFRQT